MKLLEEILPNVGDERRDIYKYKSMFVQSPSDDIIITPKLIIKPYMMVDSAMSKNSQFIRDYNEANTFIEHEIEEGRIKPKIGLGFSILSKDTLNVCIWNDGYYTDVINNNLYTYNPERGLLSATRENVNEVGSFCTNEGKIFSHEIKAWEKYLKSEHTIKDKEAYLEDRITGPL